MSIQDFTNSPLGIVLALGIGKAIPSRQGYALAGWLANRISASDNRKMVQSVRANQWVVAGGNLSKPELDAVTLATFRNTGRSLYDLYHNIDNPAGILRKVTFSPEFEAFKRKAAESSHGWVVVCPHMSNFDLAGRALGLSGLKFLVLSYPEPPTGYRWQNYMRRKTGLEILPMSVTALRTATERLQAGGIVLTGVDRPIEDANYRPLFFGRPAYLPVGHVRLALKTGSPVLVVSCMTRPDGTYYIEACEPITMKAYTDRQDEILRNAEPILERVEEFIRREPTQWSMFYPVWPDAISEAPGHPDSKS